MFVFVLVLAFLIPRATTVSAGDYVSDAIEALKTSSVYVAPGTEGTNYNTSAELSVFLDSGTNVVLVMLPREAITDTDLRSIAQKISTGLNNQKTIGLSVGNQTIGYSVVLPEGVASDLMSRATSVSNNTTTALVAYSRNVQLWYTRNPQPTPTPMPTAIPTPKPTPKPIDIPETNEVPAGIWVLVIGGFFAFIVISAVQIKKGRDKRKYNSLISKTR